MFNQDKNPINESQKTVKVFKGLLGKSEIHMSQYEGVDFSKLAFLFCGQGQMVPGLMADEVSNSEFFKARLEELDRIAAEEGVESPSQFILSPSKIKNLSLGSVLSLYTLQAAMFETLIINGYFPNVLSAHSFGEFAQLTASGLVEFEDMVRILIRRQKSLESVKGKFTMFAVSNSNKVREADFDFECYAANINTTLQTSYVCQEKDFAEIQKSLRSKKVAAVKINVDYPYHTPWLKPACNEFSQRLQDLDFVVGEQKIPFISSVTGEYLVKEVIDKKKVVSLITDQLIKPVNFVEQIKRIHNLNIGHFVELSPIDVLTPFVEQITEESGKEYKTTSFRQKIKKDSVRKKKVSSLKNSKVMGVFNKALKSLSGYSIDDIQLEDRIREDLGIDSIKKAEIIFEIADTISLSDQNSAPLNLAELATFGDILDYFDRSIEAKAHVQQAAEKKSVEFSLIKKRYKSERLVDYSSYEKKDQVKIFDLNFLSLSKEKLEECKDSDVLVLTHFDEAVDDYLKSAVEWMSYFKKVNLNPKKWILLHDGGVFSEMMSAFFLAWAQEKNCSFKSLKAHKRDQVDYETLYKESFDFFCNEVEYLSSGERRVKGYVDAPKQSNENIFKKVVVFGGFGGIGTHLVQALNDFKCEELVVLGRKKEQELGVNFDDLNLPTKVVYRSLDVTCFDDLEKVMSEIEIEGPVDLAIHSVGYEFSRLFAETTEQEIHDTIHAKVLLAQFLSSWAKKNPSSQVLLNSSVISEFGNIGQAPYALANRYLDSLAEQHENIISVLWPAWEGVGMAADEFIAKSLKLQGLPSVTPEKGKELFRQCLQFSNGKLFVLSSAFMPDYFSVNQSRSEFRGLFQSASKNRQVYVLSGLTQEKQPYLKDHLVKRVCLFPASGSLALMLFRGYQEHGTIGNVRDFSAHNFLIVGEKSSNYFLEAVSSAKDKMFLQVKASQLISESSLQFDRWKSQSTLSHFKSEFALESEFDQNIAVYIGPDFKLDQGVYLNQQSHLLIEVDLNQSPMYTGIDILDKFHKLIEASFHSACLKSLWDHSKMVVPKSIAEINFDLSKFKGHKFYSIAEEVKSTESGCHCSIFTYNSAGEVVFEIKDLRLILVKQYQEETKILRKVESSQSFFNVL